MAEIIRYFDELYIKEGVEAWPAGSLDTTGWTKISDLREQAGTKGDKGSEVNMGNGSILVTSEQIDFTAKITLNTTDLATLRALKNTRVTIVLVDSEGSKQDCPMIRGIMLYPKVDIVSNEDSLVEIIGTKKHSDLDNFFKLVDVA